jgi:hypothetical protein
MLTPMAAVIGFRPNDTDRTNLDQIRAERGLTSDVDAIRKALELALTVNTDTIAVNTASQANSEHYRELTEADIPTSEFHTGDIYRDTFGRVWLRCKNDFNVLWWQRTGCN